jgi:HAD superfamily hydrolase (TIGR01450 family)
MAWILDLDGVIWLGEQPIPRAAEAVARLQQAGERVGFVTNNSNVARADVEAKLGRFGIDAGDGVITSAMAAAQLVETGETVLLCGGPGVRSELEAKGVAVVEQGDADAVIVGLHGDFDYRRITAAMVAVRGGARLIGTNDDATYPTPAGPVPGAGALLAAVATASGVTPVVAGKPYAPMVRLVQQHFGADGVLVGDRPDTDGRFAYALGYRFALVLSGVTGAAQLPVDPVPHVVADDLAALVTAALA